ncbi:unnamed protein product [Blepharisma stoltei]|uniref:Uncharacterized protein n=1 Tax=Blepharisma stoltei TaxID=1481888 RepID=A0AAU9JGY0_9CILI|nr:unnamed protein product [Blepharisma stoltei]
MIWVVNNFAENNQPSLGTLAFRVPLIVIKLACFYEILSIRLDTTRFTSFFIFYSLKDMTWVVNNFSKNHQPSKGKKQQSKLVWKETEKSKHRFWRKHKNKYYLYLNKLNIKE